MNKVQPLAFTMGMASLFALLLITFLQHHTINLAGAAAEPGPAFAEVAASVGITSPHAGLTIPGQAWGDYNNDGHLDLFLADSFGPSTLYENNGDGTFDISPFAPQVAMSGTKSAGALFGDYNNDGWLDLYVLNIGPNALFRNDEGAGFTNVTNESGTGENGNGQTGAWGDYDEDGFLDLYVTNWWCQDPDCTNESRDGLFHNNGDGTFTNIVTHTLPFTETDKPTFVASFLDFDNDEDLDIYVVADKRFGNTLYRNDGPGCGEWCFTDVSVAAGANTEVDGMGLGVSDYDNDGDLDLFFSNAGPPVLLQNQTSQGNPVFVDASVPAGVAFDSISWGTVFFDYNNDGCQDIYLAIMNTEPGFENRLFENNCDSTFSDVSAGSGADNGGQSFGVAYGDYDGDGWLDLVVGNIVDRYYLYQNLGGSNNWLHVVLTGGGSMNRDAIGSRVYLNLSDGRTLMQELKSGSSLGSGNEIALHFGLGTTDIISAEIRWADGMQETIAGDEIPLNQVWEYGYPLPEYTMMIPAVLFNE